jgi:hypothetical protein
VGHLDRILERSVIRRWSRAGLEADQAEPAFLRGLGRQARRLSRRFEQMMQATEQRLLPNAALPRPLHADWAWRPEPWSVPLAPVGLVSPPSGAGFGADAKFFHDCPDADFMVRQIRVPSGAPVFALDIEVLHFDGRFLSMAVDLPREAVDGLSRRHILRIGLDAEMDVPVRCFGRLNVRHGPNVAQVVQAFGDAGHVDLDLATAELDEDGVSAAWIDVILERPAMNRFRLADLTVSRRPRAEF